MQETLTFIDSVMGFDSLNSEKLKSSKIFSFNIFAHKFLVEKNIEHDIAEKHLEKYFSNPTTASEKLANTLTSYSN